MGGAGSGAGETEPEKAGRTGSAAADWLRAARDRVLSEWEALVRRDLAPEPGHSVPVLREAGHLLVRQVEQALDAGQPPSFSDLRDGLDASESFRALLDRCPVDQVMQEIGLLRTVLLHELEREAAPPAPQRDLLLAILDVVQRGVVAGCMVGRRHAQRSEAEQHRLLVENARDFGMFLCDLEGRIVNWNSGAERITGFTAAEAIGRPAAFIFTPEDRAQGAPESELRRAATEGRATNERWHVRKDGTRFWGSGMMEAVYDDSGRLYGFGKVMRDHTERQRIEAERAELLARVSALYDIADSLLLTDDPQEMVGHVFRRLAGYLKLEVYFNYLIAADGAGLVLNVCGGIPAEMVPSLRRLSFGETVCGVVGQTGIPRTAGEVQYSGDPLLEIARSLGLTAYTCQPLIAGERLLGTLSFGCRRRSHFSEAELQLIQTVANQVAVALDRTRVLQELADRAAALSTADRLKDEFLAMLAHELRNPLAPILTAVEVMRLRSENDVRLARSWEAVERQVRQMTRLLEDLLDVSRITRGKIELRREPADLREAVTHAVQTSRPWMDAKNQQLAVVLPDEPVMVDVDPARVEQILVNLLNNAAKYTEPGGKIRLMLEFTNVGPRMPGWETSPPGDADAGAETVPHFAVLRVRDSGRGIPAEMLPFIFDLFTQVEATLDRSAGGLGLGLTLVKRLVELHGGAVSVHSDGPGRGSEFTITLPIREGVKAEGNGRMVSEPDPLQADPVSVHLSSPDSQSPKHILVVDDNVDVAHTLADLLELWGHQPVIALDGLQALVAARESHPEVVLLDIGLPGLDGYQVARRLRGELNFRGLLIAITGYGQDGDVRKALAAGFDRHITKPVSPETLRSLLVSDRME